LCFGGVGLLIILPKLALQKEARLQELKRRRKCVRKKMRSDISMRKEEATEILLGFIDIKIISLVLKILGSLKNIYIGVKKNSINWPYPRESCTKIFRLCFSHLRKQANLDSSWISDYQMLTWIC